MTLEKAREWANRNDRIQGVFHPDAKAAIEVIQSLPDQWVDVKKVREEAGRMRKGAVNAMKPGHNEFSRGYAEAMRECARHLRNILTPKLPTLADMTPEEREACVGMQADYVPLSEVPERVIIMNITSLGAQVMSENFGVSNRDGSRITPLPDLPKPVDAPPAEKAALPKPEDVPPNELWLVERGESQWFAKRIRGWSKDFAWRLTSMSRGPSIARDSDITLIHKLVPEPPALPDGMRLADHEALGRIIVSPKEDSDGDHLAFFSDESTRCGANWTYLQKSEFTYLDGETK